MAFPGKEKGLMKSWDDVNESPLCLKGRAILPREKSVLARLISGAAKV